MNAADSTVPHPLAHHWWVLALRGLAAVAFGVLALVLPGLTLLTLVLLFGAYALANGALALGHAFSGPRGSPPSAALVVTGLLSLAAGVVTLAWPGITVLTLVLLIGAWAVLNGMLEIAMAARLRRAVPHGWLLTLAGILSVLLGLIILLAPAASALALVWWIGGFVLAFGALLIVLALRVRRGEPLEMVT